MSVDYPLWSISQPLDDFLEVEVYKILRINLDGSDEMCAA